MFPGSLPLIFNGSVLGHENCSMYAGVQCTQLFNLVGSTVWPCMCVACIAFFDQWATFEDVT